MIDATWVECFRMCGRAALATLGSPPISARAMDALGGWQVDSATLSSFDHLRVLRDAAAPQG